MLYGVGLFAVRVPTQSQPQNPEELPDGTEVPDGIFVPRGSHPSLTVVDDPSRRTASRRLYPMFQLSAVSNVPTVTQITY